MPIPSLFTGAGALTVQQNAISVIANNIANVNTTAFKSSNVHFAEEISNSIRAASSSTGTRGGTNPAQVGTGMSLSDVSTNFAQGSLKNTGAVTDMALSGNGFFVVSGSMEDDASSISDGKYTRDGHFLLDAQGNLTTAGGDRVIGATLYNPFTGEAKSISGYGAVTYFSDQDIGSSIYPTDGGTSPNLAVPAPTAVNVTGSAPTFDATKISEISVRGSLIDATTGVNTTTKGDLRLSRQEDGKLLFRFDNANAGTSASVFTASLNTDQQFLDNVISLKMANASGAEIQLRVRLEPGVTDIEDVFAGIEYDSTTATSDTLTFGGSAATTQASTDITVADADFQYMSVADINTLFSPIKIPSFFYTVDPSLEKETASFSVEQDGSISIFGPASEQLRLGRVLVSNFANADGLSSEGGNKFNATSNSGVPAISVIGGPFDQNAASIAATKLVSGSLESSNVNIANEFAELIALQRGLQFNARTISTSDEILQTLINV